jgi:hypothetical protein
METQERASFSQVAGAAGFGTGDAQSKERVSLGGFIGSAKKRRGSHAMA